jgi:hypothetical protein
MESETVSLSTDKGLNANLFFSNTDLLLKIFDYLLWDDNDETDSDNAITCKHTLAQAAVTCKTFLEPALDRLWYILDTLFPLLKLLPSFIQCEESYVSESAHLNLSFRKLSSGPSRTNRLVPLRLLCQPRQNLQLHP